MVNIIELIIGMIFILIAAMIFCNALEHLGEKLGLSEGVTGSIFVAVGTAMPETIVPLIALFASPTGGQIGYGDEIGLGAILGPSLMLSTLSVALMALSVYKKRGIHGLIQPEKSGLSRDLKFFGTGYGLAMLLAVSHNFYNNPFINISVVIILIFSYFLYVLLTVRASSNLVKKGHQTKASARLYLSQYLGLTNNLLVITLQAIIGFAGLVYFARIFINSITHTSEMFHIPAFLISVVLVPVATELPEKINSILWIRRGRDTLAMANITGSMVFQGLLLPAVGILFTGWQLPLEKSISVITTLIAISWLFSFLIANKPYKVWHFIVSGALYFLSLMISLIGFN